MKKTPMISEIVNAALMKGRDDFTNVVRAGRTRDWPEPLSLEFSCTMGLYAALRAAGVSAELAALQANSLVRQWFEGHSTRLQFWVTAPLEGRSMGVSADGFPQFTIETVSEMMAGGAGRFVAETEGRPDPVLDRGRPADVLTVINIQSVIERMSALYRG